jgi:ketosteroid isomerase-like protein
MSSSRATAVRSSSRGKRAGKRSGAPIDHLETAVFTLSDGKIVRWETYWDADEGMRAVGLDL